MTKSHLQPIIWKVLLQYGGKNEKAMWPADEEITWEKFKDQFRKYHIPAGVMKVKQREFRALLQGSQSVSE